MTTYNGERFLEQQLKSIMKQTRQPDEVIICDDCSSDGSHSIVENFIEEYRLSSKWKLYRNDYNEGVDRNFMECAGKVTGDIIFFCDQDDVWLPEKISEMENIFTENNDVLALNCAFSVIDENGNEKNSLFSRFRMGNGKLRRISFAKQINRCIVNGMTLAVRREEYFQMITFISDYGLTYDIPVSMLMSLKGGYYTYDKPLVLRRIHQKNVSSPSFTLAERLQEAKKHIDGRNERIRHMEAVLLKECDKMSTKDRIYLEQAIISIKNSVEYMNKRRILPLLKDFMRYNPMVNKAIAFLNILVAMFGKHEGAK